MLSRIIHLTVFINLLLVQHLYGAPAVDSDVMTSSGSMPICDVSINDDDVDVDTTVLADCVEKWKGVLNDYVRALRKDKRFDICGKYVELRKCLTSYISLCRRFGGDVSLDWMAVVEQIEPICINKSKHHMKMHECLVEEMGGVLSSRCDEYHQFNLKQKTRHECHFLRETIHCRSSLVTSGCGNATGSLALHLLKFHHRKLATKLKCHIDEQHTFKTFSYSTKCNRNFLEDIESCTTGHLTTSNVAEFHDDNDLVSTNTEHDFRVACRAYRRFTSCLTPINETCSDGVEMFLEYEGNLRRYMLKMDHICQEGVLGAYASSLSCYQSVMNNGQLSQCNVHWNNLRPWLSNITAYQFFCDPSHVNTVNLLLEIQKSHMCHRTVFRNECGHNASTIMADLMDRALKDPLYLRLGFRPDCQLHQQSSSFDNPPITTSTSTYDDDDDDGDDDYDNDEEREVFVTSEKHGLAGNTPVIHGHHGDGNDDVSKTSPTPPYWTTKARLVDLQGTNSAVRWREQSVPLLLFLVFHSILNLSQMIRFLFS